MKKISIIGFENGVHYRRDNMAGEISACMIGDEIVEWAKNNGHL